MSNDRTPPWLIPLKFFALCSPVGIIAAILLAPFALPLILSFGVTLFLFWHGTRLFSNAAVRMVDMRIAILCSHCLAIEIQWSTHRIIKWITTESFNYFVTSWINNPQRGIGE